MHDTRLSLASEVTELERLLAGMSQDRVIDRMSLESRLASVRVELAALPEKAVSKAKLTFRGKPVFGSHGIAADFGSKAAGAFADAFAAVAAGLGESLNYMGPIPNRDKRQLLITGTAIGSFGFEFELPASEPTLLVDPDPASVAMTKIEELFRRSAEGSDDDMAEVIEAVHPRAVKKVREFLEFLAQQQAWCGLEYADKSFRYVSADQIQAACDRLKDENIQEQPKIYQGEFQGVLPSSRTFEFQQADNQGVIKGKVALEIEDPDQLNRQWLHKVVRVQLNVMQVGQGRPRYTLMSLDTINVIGQDSL